LISLKEVPRALWQTALRLGGGSMSYYRLYLIENGRFVGFEEIDAADDDQALRIAEQRNGTHAVELWCGKRMVRSFAVKREAEA
jgi:hypothetical protein